MDKEKEYSKTVNLPKTDFQMKANLPQREPAFVEEWENERLYVKMCEKIKIKKIYFSRRSSLC